MRFLHTGDWHVGRAIRQRSRLDEFERVLSNLVAIAVDQKVDAVLIAGDIWEQRMPAPEADAIVFETFVQLHAARIPVVAIAGNHDSAVRLGALAKLLRAIDVTLIPKVASIEEAIVEIPARSGDEIAQIACLPFVAERFVADAGTLFDSAAQTYELYADRVGWMLSSLAGALRPDAVQIVLAHLFADGARFGKGEREVSIGANYAVPPSRLPATVNYVALGHIHRPQDVNGAPSRARYPGSLLQLDFGEVEQEKSVTIVETSAGKPAAITTIPLSGARELIDLHGSLDELRAQAHAAGDAYVRVFVRTDGPVPGIADEVRDILPKAVDVQLEYARTDREERSGLVSSLSARDQFIAYHRNKYDGVDPHTSIMEAFDEVHAELTGNVL